ncbi:MAG: sigma-70 family RNA polymerase sigma factor [Pseudomonadota bacterium]
MSSCQPACYRPAAFSCYLHDVGRHQLLNPEQEKTLCLAMSQGDINARQSMIEGNLRLVIRIAKRYQRNSLCLDDLVSEGNIGLMRATAKFNPSLGYRFSTYATHWINESIRRGIMNQARLVRLPVHVAKRLNVYLAAQRRMSQHSYRNPCAEEIALATGDSVGCVRELMVWQDSPSSLQVPSENGQSTWQDSLADEQTLSPAEHAEQDDLMSNLQRFIAQLKPREQQILCARFGMGGRKTEETLENIAREVGVTRERIRQIQIHILHQLKAWLIEAGYDATCLASLERR